MGIKLTICLAIFCRILWSSEIIGTSSFWYPGLSNADRSYGQRLIARNSSDDLFVVYPDIAGGKAVIKFVKQFRNARGELEWAAPAIVTAGYAPSLSMSKSSCLYLVYLTGDSVVYRTMKRDSVWSEPHVVTPVQELLIKRRMEPPEKNVRPRIDIDGADRPHIIWLCIQSGAGYLLHYTIDKGISHRSIVTNSTIGSIGDFDIASNLLYSSTDIFVVCEAYSGLNMPKIHLFTFREGRTYWKPVSFDYPDVKPFPGTSPRLAVGYSDLDFHHDIPVIMYQNQNKVKTAVLWQRSGRGLLDTFDLVRGPVASLGIDNPIARENAEFSFIYTRSDSLYHHHVVIMPNQSPSGTNYRMTTNTIVTGKPLDPSLTYKQFNSGYIDVVWAQTRDTVWNIMYQRMFKWLVAVNEEGRHAIQLPYMNRPAIPELFDYMGRHIGPDARFLKNRYHRIISK